MSKRKQKVNKGTLRRVLELIRPYAGLVLLTLVLAVVTVVTTLLAPVISGKAVDHIIGPGQVDFGGVGKLAIAMAGTVACTAVSHAGVKGTLGKVVAGGAMMGPAVENLSYPTTKTTSGLIFLSKAAAEPAPVNPCIRCGRCVEYCPMGLEPVEVNQAYAARDVQELGKLHADYCFNCGSCSFVCPAKRPVTQMMSLAKAFYLGKIKKGGNK